MSALCCNGPLTQDADEVLQLGKQWQDAIMDLADACLFFEQVKHDLLCWHASPRMHQYLCQDLHGYSCGAFQTHFPGLARVQTVDLAMVAFYPSYPHMDRRAAGAGTGTPC